jgi:hypothetical protein
MRGIILTIGLLLFFIKSYAQEKDVEKNIFGVQLGIYPVSFYNEYRLVKFIALRSEIGFSFEYSSNLWDITPDINLEPRFYYNLNRRNNLNKVTTQVLFFHIKQ